MVAVVVGSRLGLEQTSGWVLGSRGQLGQATLGRGAESVFVNAATGNLVLTQRDEFLLGQGADSAVMRSYNSRSNADGDNNDGWRVKRTVSDAGGVVTRTDWDGSVVTYSLVAGTTDLYRTYEGGGAYDTLRKVGITWVWTDGDSQYTETYATYAADQYRIVNRLDTDGQGLTFSYNPSGHLSRVSAQTVDGRTDYTDFIYGTGDASADLLELRNGYVNAAGVNKIETRTRYAYDASHRLITVTIDQTPGDALVADGRVYVTRYAYDGASNRIKTISQTDGSKIEIGYEAGGGFRVTSISQTVVDGVTRTTSFAYVSATRTNVTGPDGLVTELSYDSAGQLTKVTEPAAAGSGVAAQVREFTYDAFGNVTRIKLAPNVWTDFVYQDLNGNGVDDVIGGDHNGLWTHQYIREGYDAAQGKDRYLAADRTYNARNAVLTETRYTGYDLDGAGTALQAAGALTTRYVYDSENHLRYVISAAGNVTKYDYHTNGNLVRTIAYTAVRYDGIDSLTVREAPTLSQMDGWVAAIGDKTKAQITETVYDFRGAVQTTYAYAEVKVNGGAEGGGVKTTTQYVYDHHGRLTSRYVVGVPGVETYVYDALDRVVAAVDFNGGLTTSAFYDAAGTTVVTNADGLNRISVYNRAGERVSYTETTRPPERVNLLNLNGWPVDGATAPATSVVDGWQNINGLTTEGGWSTVTGPDGQPVVVIHAGQSSDANPQGGGAQTNSIQIDGSKAYEFVYYFRKSDLTRHGLFFGVSPSATQAYVEGGVGWTDNDNPYFYSASPAVQQSTYEADRWYKVVAYVLPAGTATIPAGAVGGVYDMTTGLKVATPQTFRWNDTRPDNSIFSRFFLFGDNDGAANQVNTTYFYKPEVRQVDTGTAVTPPSTQYRYDNQGRLRLIIDETGVTTHHIYDRVGRKVADIDGDGSLVEYQYDVYDRPIATIRYGTRINTAALVDAGGNPIPIELSAIRPAAHADDAWNWTVYDLAGRVVQTIDGSGGAVVYDYDGAGRLVSSTEYANAFGQADLAGFKIGVARPPQAVQKPAGNANDRVTRHYYDVDGRQVGVLDAEGFLSLTDYDNAGRVIFTRGFATRPADPTASLSVMRQQLQTLNDSKDITSWFVYDGRGFLRGTVGGEGEVALYDYSPLGHLTEVIRGRKLSAMPTTQPTLADLTAGEAPANLEVTTYTRNAYGQVLTEARALAGGTETITYTYDVLGRLTATWTDRITGAGQDSGTRHRYDQQGRLIGQLGGEGVAALLALGGSPTSADVEGVWRAWGVSLAYDDADRLIARTEPDGVGGAGRKTLYFYDPDGNLAYEVDAIGQTTGYRYDALNRRTETIGFGALTALAGLTGGAVVASLPSRTTLAAADRRTVVRYNATDTVREIEQRLTGTDNAVTSFTYNAFGELSKRTDDKGLSGSALTSDTTFAYDRRGQLIKTIDDAGALKRTTQAVYDAFGRAVQTTDARNVVRDTEYDRAGRVHIQYGALVNGVRETTTYGYDARGNVISVEDSFGKVTLFAHSAFKRTLTLTLPEGGVTTTTFDDRGHTLTVIDPDQHATTYAYDRDGRLKTATNAAGQTVNTYDAAGQLYETVNAAGVTVRYTYDAIGRVLEQLVDPNEAKLKTSYAYLLDADGPRTRITNASGVSVDYKFDLAGRQTRITHDPDGLKLATIHTYDHAGNVIQTQEVEGAQATVVRETTYAYDKLGRRLTQQIDSASLNLLSTFAYDLNGNVVSRTDRVDATTSVVTRFAYDAENRLTFTVDPTGALTRTEYDVEGRITRTVAYANRPGFPANYVYSDGNLRISADAAASPAGDMATAFIYDDDGRQTFIINALGHLTQRLYFPSGALKQTIQYEGVVPTATLRTDGALEALVAQAAFRAQGIRLERSVYDVAGRLAFSIDVGGAVVAYAYNGAGQVTSQTRYGVLYTAAGQPTSQDMTAWIAANPTAPTQQSRMVYDAAGRLAFGIDAGGAVTAYLYDGAGQVISQTRYGVLYTATGQPTFQDMTTWVTANPTAPKQQSRMVYDSAGRLAFSIDAGGAVTAYGYDGVGQVTSQTRYGVLYAAADQPKLSDMTAWVAANPTAPKQQSRMVYDAAGRMVFGIDAGGGVTGYAYDALGQIKAKTRYVARYAGSASPSAATMATWAANNGSVGDQTARSVYDGAGRLIYGVDANLTVTAYVYDAFGKVSRQVRYAAPYTSAAEPTAVGMADWASGNTSSLDRTSRAFYDGVGRQTFTVNAENYVTGYTYDTAGHVLTETRYALQVSDAQLATSGALTTALVTSDKVETRYVYDAAGQVERVFDALGVETYMQRDAFGRVTDLWQANNTPSLRTHTERTYDVAGRLLSETKAAGTAEWSRTTWGYDNFGRAETETRGIGANQAGVTTTRTFDAMDRVRTVSQPLAGSTVARTTTTYDAFGNVRSVEDPRGGVGYFFHDALNRLIWQVDPEGYATRTTYDLIVDDPAVAGVQAQVAETVTRFMEKVAANWSKLAPPDAPAGAASTTTLVRDKLDRVIRVVDAQNQVESYTFNAFGDRASLTNKKGGLTTYLYDKRGLLKSETLPVTALNGGVQTLVRNSYEYDARGNLTKTIQAEGFPEARTTRYDYDKRDRLVEKRGDAVTVTTWVAVSTLNPATGLYTRTAVATDTTSIPTEKISYDALGNVTKTEAASGAVTRYAYDHLGRKTAEIAQTGRVGDVPAVGVLRTWAYDASNNAVEMKVYDTAVTLPTNDAWTGADRIPADQAGRHVVYGYDLNNRLVSTTLKQVRVGSFANGAYTTGTALVDVTDRTTYDASGNVTSTTDANGAKTWFFYDAVGRQSATIDAAGYATTWERDAEGNVKTEVRYATRYAGTPQEGVYPTGLPARTGEDRETRFTYDANGRRKTETRLAVVSFTVDANGQMTETTGPAVVRYDYDALGNITRKTEANSVTDATQFEYDQLGRLTKTTYADVGPGLRRVVDNTYDALGAVVRVVDGQDGLSEIYKRLTTYAYDKSGHMVSMSSRTNLSGEAETLFTRAYAYDAGGNVVRETYLIRTDGSDKVFEGRRYDYDAQGRVIEQSAIQTTTTAAAPAAGAVWTVGDRQVTTYNTHGDVVAKGIRGPNGELGAQETFAYDAAGRLWRTNAGDGSVRLFVHDANGAVTLTIASSGYDLTGLSLASALDLISTTNAGVRTVSSVLPTELAIAFNVYDARGQLTDTIEPERQLRYSTSIGASPSTGPEKATLVRTRAYNAFGEVSSETDPRSTSYVTNFSYNTMGRLILQESPAVKFTDDKGVQSPGLVRPKEHRYFDLSGRLVGVRDANGNLTRRTLLNGSGHNGDEAIIAAEFRASGHTETNGQFVDNATASVTRYETDVFGQVIKTTDALNRVEERLYDFGGRMVRHYRPTRADGSRAIERYVYDGLGRRTEHRNAALLNDDGTIAGAFTRYDMEGRITAFTDFAGHTTGYSYLWVSSLATKGLAEGAAAFGGWRKVTTHASGLRQETVNTDYFGREVGKTNFGGHVIEKGFDKAGRLVLQTSSAGQALQFTWYNTGLISGQSDTAGNRFGYSTTNTTAQYEYDEAGNRLREVYSTKSWVYTYAPGIFQYIIPPEQALTGPPVLMQDSTATYDARGRMVSLIDTLASGTTNLAWEYDLNGNIRRVQATHPSIDGVAQPAVDDWYLYDAQNRMVLVQGTRTGEVLHRKNGRGVNLAYNDAGERVVAMRTQTGSMLTGVSWPPGASEPIEVYEDYDMTVREDYTYTADGYLHEVFRNEGGFGGAVTPKGALLARDTRDVLGRLVLHEEKIVNGVAGYWQSSTYDNASMVTRQVTRTQTPKSDGTNYWTVNETLFDYRAQNPSGYWDGAWMGTLTHVSTSVTYENGTGTASPNGSAAPTETTYEYVWFDDARQSKIIFDGDIGPGGSGSEIWTSSFNYDVNGRLSYVNIKDGQPRTVTFVSDSNGQVLTRKVDDNKSNTPKDPWNRYLYFNGLRVGDMTNDGPSGTDYAAGLNSAIRTGTSLFQSGGPKAFVDFDQAYEGLQPGSLSGGEMPYTVRAGDSLQTIAAAVWGDSSLWYLIAEKNSLNAASLLTAGQVLTIPSKLANFHNSSDTFRPYNPNEAIGDVNPSQPKPPPKPGGCGGIGQILMVVIAVAVSIWTAGALAGATGWLGSFIGATGGATGFGAGAIAGVAGSVASQAFGVATGIQDSFDWKAVGIAALSGGIGAKLGGGSLKFVKGDLAGNIGRGVVRGAVGNAVTQGVAKAVGLQDSFSWTAVAVGGVVGGVTAGIDTATNNISVKGGYTAPDPWSAQGIANSLAAGVGGAVAGAATRSLIQGGGFGDNLLAALPDVIGATIGNAIGARVSPLPAMNAKAQERQAAAQYAEGIDRMMAELKALQDRIERPFELGPLDRSLIRAGFGVYGADPVVPQSALRPLNTAETFQPTGRGSPRGGGEGFRRTYVPKDTRVEWTEQDVAGTIFWTNPWSGQKLQTGFTVETLPGGGAAPESHRAAVHMGGITRYDRLDRTEWGTVWLSDLDPSTYIAPPPPPPPPPPEKRNAWGSIEWRPGGGYDNEAEFRQAQYNFHFGARVQAGKEIEPYALAFLTVIGAAIAVPLIAAAVPVAAAVGGSGFFAATGGGVTTTNALAAGGLASALVLGTGASLAVVQASQNGTFSSAMDAFDDIFTLPPSEPVPPPPMVMETPIPEQARPEAIGGGFPSDGAPPLPPLTTPIPDRPAGFDILWTPTAEDWLTGPQILMQANSGWTQEQAELPLDWSGVDPNGLSRIDHVRLHSRDDLTKPIHGVFTGDPILTTEAAWERVRADRIQPSVQPNNGNLRFEVPMARPPGQPSVGWQGGYNGTGAALDSVWIITRPNGQLVTSFPQ